MSGYQTYQDILENGRNQSDMDYNERQRLIKNIDLLDTKDHIGVLKIIMDMCKSNGENDQSETSGRKVYTVNNYGTYFDLNDLDNSTLWKISYHVSLCLDNVKRDEFRKQVEKQYNDDRVNLEDQMRLDAKLKLTTNRLKIDKFKPLTKENINNRDRSNDNQINSNDVTDDLEVGGANEEFDLLPGRPNNDLTLLSNYSDDPDQDIVMPTTKIEYDDDE